METPADSWQRLLNVGLTAARLIRVSALWSLFSPPFHPVDSSSTSSQNLPKHQWHCWWVPSHYHPWKGCRHCSGSPLTFNSLQNQENPRPRASCTRWRRPSEWKLFKVLNKPYPIQSRNRKKNSTRLAVLWACLLVPPPFLGSSPCGTSCSELQVLWFEVWLL